MLVIISATEEEMRCFFGMRVFMSVVHVPTLRMYWSSDELYGGFQIAKFMTRDRFDEISANIHANDNTTRLPRDDPNFDKLHLIRPVLDEVMQCCLREYNPHRNCSIDEAMVAFRGRLGWRQYMPAKPTKYGMKVWMRADPVNAYCNEFEVYTGRVQQDRPERGLGERVVKELSVKLRGGNYVVNNDNYFTSVPLFESLLDEGILARGTVRINRRGLPRRLLSEPIPKQQGDLKSAQRGRMTAYAWKDKRIVNLLSTADDPTLENTVQRKQKDGSKKEVPCPVALRQYNIYMGGVDRADQLRTQDPTSRMCRRWWTYLFWFLFDVAVSNAFILMKESEAHQRVNKRGNPQPITLLDFRKELSKQLLPERPPEKKRKYHCLKPMDSRKTCVACGDKRCETKTVCLGCDKYMCVKRGYIYHGMGDDGDGEGHVHD